MRTLSRQITTFARDDTWVSIVTLTRSITRSLSRSAMYLAETCIRRSLVRPFRVAKFLLRAKAARKDSAVHVSLSSDKPFKQPGNRRDSRPQVSQRAVEA